ncbi:hypothetical protein AN958_08275 [Leucoagaricus sp. SymC.cos]|nr:hypothetical protein AN958_08275 [Leucoagaricus sp. SymC.cos]
MVVVKCLQSGAYILAEVNGAVLKCKFMAFRIIPYHPQSHQELQVTEFVDPLDLVDVEEEF